MTVALIWCRTDHIRKRTGSSQGYGISLGDRKPTPSIFLLFLWGQLPFGQRKIKERGAPLDVFEVSQMLAFSDSGIEPSNGILFVSAFMTRETKVVLHGVKWIQPVWRLESGWMQDKGIATDIMTGHLMKYIHV